MFVYIYSEDTIISDQVVSIANLNHRLQVLYKTGVDVKNYYNLRSIVSTYSYRYFYNSSYPTNYYPTNLELPESLVVNAFGCEENGRVHAGMLFIKHGGGRNGWMTRAKWNSYLHSLNGNIPKYLRYSDIYFQNIPGSKNVANVQICLDVLLSKKPLVIGLGEVSHHKLQQCHFPGYTLVKGRQNNITTDKNIRLNVLTKEGLSYQELDISNDIPTCALKYHGWNLVFVYREWAVLGDNRTLSIPLQNSRWDTFVPRWNSLKGKTLLLGDFNFCQLNTTSNYQRQFDHIRDSVSENFLLEGYAQLLEEETRFQKNSTPGLLDHIYLNDTFYVERVYNSPEIDSDHNLVGLRLRHDGPVHQPKYIQSRDIKGIDVDDFEKDFLNSNLHEILY